MRTRTLITFVFAAMALMANAQSPQKIGWADWGYIMENMPESKAMQTELQTYANQLETYLKGKQQEFQTKYDEFTKLPATTPEAIRAGKQRDLQALDEGLQKAQQDAQTGMQKKQGELMDPILDKIQKNIETVAKENGYSFIVNPDLGGEMTTILLYADKQFDISDLVLKKMGITPPPAAQR